ncbi:MAG: preprotein translocase subunit SecA [Waddliaceae bacterium]|nr:preprotein translocase subunit SecA [Waddliaceae bacterium]
MFGLLKRLFGTAQSRQVKKFRSIVNEVNRWDEEYKSLSDEELKAKTNEFRQRISNGETVDQLLPEAYGAVKNCCRRLVGAEVHVSGYEQQWDMVPYDVQIIGAIAMHHASIAEMQTGEGKTLTAVMPLYLNALTGKSVHLVTVNDYLAKRDCEWVGCVLRWMGLTTGALTNDIDPRERKDVYACDVVYGTSSEFGFDYLRDNSMALRAEEQVQRGHYFAIVDEIDSILIDEARTPLIISGPVPNSKQLYNELKTPVSTLVKKQRDYCNKIASDSRKIILSAGYFQERQENAISLDKDQEAQVRKALQQLWLVSKGTPQNRILKRALEDPDLRAGIDEWDLYYYGDQNKQEKADALSELYIVVNEKANEYELTDKGMNLWSDCNPDRDASQDFVMLDISDEYMNIDQNPELSSDEKMQAKLKIQELDELRKERAHDIRQLFRAHLLMENDVDYIVQDEKIVIIDENTGRPQPGRRFSDGLHQAIEAKEGVAIQKETQTYATITLQNFFRMYDKLAGMTGTAMTEAGEFAEIYKLQVLEIPTHNPCARKDANDEIYMTEREKYHAILKEVTEISKQGRPILIGTESVEVSEKLSRIFRTNKLPHTVLNAKNHEREAEIIAQAGQNSAITIATNMAGRGTDIKLGKGISELGGLHVIGTTRHQSRRIDRQLRGRCARQGDPGGSKFYVSFEDSLMRLFASPKLTSMLQRFRPPEGEPISAGILNKSIETAQKRIEQRNHTIRKHTLEYDDVMNHQRHAIYSFRNEILHEDDILGIADDIIAEVCQLEASQYFKSRAYEEQWDHEGYRQCLMHAFPVSFEEGFFDDDHSTIEELEQKAIDRVREAFQDHIQQEYAKIREDGGSDNETHDPVKGAARNLMLHSLDEQWQEHLLSMDHLRSEVHLRAVAQKDPLQEFKHEGFRLFDELGFKLKKEIATNLFKFRVVRADRAYINQLLAQLQMERSRSLVDDIDPSEEKVEETPKEKQKPQPVTVGPRVKRNDTCPCGSGLKYKKCCGIQLEEGEE